MLWGGVVLDEGGEDRVMRQAREEVQFVQADGDGGGDGCERKGVKIIRVWV